MISKQTLSVNKLAEISNIGKQTLLVEDHWKALTRSENKSVIETEPSQDH